MKYSGLLGEFKWWGFVISLICCLGFALLLFTRFDYIKQDDNDAGKAVIQTLTNQVNSLQASIQSINHQLATDQCKCKCTAGHSGKTGSQNLKKQQGCENEKGN